MSVKQFNPHLDQDKSSVFNSLTCQQHSNAAMNENFSTYYDFQMISDIDKLIHNIETGIPDDSTLTHLIQQLADDSSTIIENSHHLHSLNCSTYKSINPKSHPPPKDTNQINSIVKNFPKFLIGDLRRVILISQNHQQKNSYNQIQLQYFEFAESDLKSKKTIKLLRTLLISDCQDDRILKEFDKFITKKKKKLHFTTIFGDFDIQQLKLKLRQRILKQEEELLRLASNRKVSDQQLFVKYVSEYLDNLRQNKMRGKATKNFSNNLNQNSWHSYGQ